MLTMAKRVSLGTTSFYGLLRQHFLVIAIPLPYAYYTFLRLFVCAASAYLAYQHFVHEDSVDRWGVLLVAIALLYDPFIPIYLTREIWILANLITATTFVLRFALLRRRIGNSDN